MQLELWNPGVVGDQARACRSVIADGVVTELVKLVDVAAPGQAVRLEQLDARVAEYVLGAHAERTRTAYRSDWQAFERWCIVASARALPASSRTLARYLTHLAELGRKMSTIRRARIAIGVAHSLAGAPRPDRDPRVRTLERGISRAHGTREQGPDPLVVEHLAKLVDIAADSARDCRDRAMLLVGFAGAYRSSELAVLNIEHLSFTERGLSVFLPRSKEDQLARGTTTEIPFGADARMCPVHALRTWLGRVGRLQGPLFRRVLGSIIEPNRIHPRAVSRAVQRLARRADIEGRYSAHSLRSGFATSAYVRGATDLEIQNHGRWKDPRSLDRYIQLNHVPFRRNVAACVL